MVLVRKKKTNQAEVKANEEMEKKKKMLAYTQGNFFIYSFFIHSRGRNFPFFSEKLNYSRVYVGFHLSSFQIFWIKFDRFFIASFINFFSYCGRNEPKNDFRTFSKNYKAQNIQK